MNTREPSATGEATYCPEDDKLRLYVGRVPRDEYLRLRAAGWACLHKQREDGGGDFAAVWTPKREDTALEYSGGIIEDEDKGPADRAADRAERFAGYREKREGEAADLADKYEAGPAVYGYQSAALAERRAAALDRVGGRAVNVWEKAEYWQRRTAGVIAHALHVAAPGVRMGRIKTIEAELRRDEKTQAEAARRWAQWEKVAGLPEPEAYALAVQVANYDSDGWQYKHPRPECVSEYVREHGTSLWSLLAHDDEAKRITGHEAAALYLGRWKRPDDPGNAINRWIRHHRLRIAYENQMLEAQGGRLAAVEMEPGGWLGKRQIQKVNKSPATGRVVSVQVWGQRTGYTKESGYQKQETRPCLVTIETERLPPNAYTAPTDEERAAFAAEKKAAKEARGTIPTINPTREDAERLQARMNAEAAAADKGRNYPRKPGTVEENTQAQYSGSYKDYRAVQMVRGVCKVRVRVHGWQHVESVVILTDKPQKPLPAAAWRDAAQAEKEQATA